jgi:hypothetical protein
MENCIKGKTTCEEQQDDTCEITLIVKQSEITLQESNEKS